MKGVERVVVKDVRRGVALVMILAISGHHVSCAPAQLVQRGKTLPQGKKNMTAQGSLAYVPDEVAVPSVSIYQTQGRKRGFETRIGLGSAGALAGAKYQWKGDDLSVFSASLAVDLQGGIFPLLPVIAIWGQGTLSVPLSYRINHRWEVYGAPGVGGALGAYASAVTLSDGFIYGMTLSQTLGFFVDLSKQTGLYIELFAAGIPLGEQSFALENRAYYGLSFALSWQTWGGF